MQIQIQVNVWCGLHFSPTPANSSLKKVMKMAAAEPKPLCKFGENCYRKNPQHLKQFRHPKRKQEEVLQLWLLIYISQKNLMGPLSIEFYPIISLALPDYRLGLHSSQQIAVIIQSSLSSNQQICLSKVYKLKITLRNTFEFIDEVNIVLQVKDFLMTYPAENYSPADNRYAWYSQV